MNYTEIIKLLDAGYSRDEIMKMGDEPEEQGKPEEQQEEDSSNSEDNNNELTGMLTEMRDMFAELRKEVTAFNIMNSILPEEKNSDDVMARIINPFDDETKGGKK